MDDEKIIELFFERSEQALAELDRKYGRLCYHLSFSILNNEQDAEECVNDAYLGIWNRIPPERPDPLQAYICKIIRNISLNLYHRKTAAKRNSAYQVALEELEDCLSEPGGIEAEIESTRLARILQDFLDSLSEENCVIFMRRYWFSDSYAEIAARVGLSQKAVSVRLTRIRKQLKNYLIEREVFV